MYSNFFKKKLVKDYGLPIKILSEPYFSYYLNLYKDHFDIASKVNSLTKSIDLVDGEQCLQTEWYRIKDLIEKEIKSLPAYSSFSEYKSSYKIIHPLENTNLYNQSMLTKTCVSIDIKSANYSSLKYFDKSLVMNTSNYTEFITKFSSVPIFNDSKIFRQLLFEPLDSKKQGHIQKEIISKAADVLVSILSPLSARRIGNDELILVFNKSSDLMSLQEEVLSKLNNFEHKDMLKVEAFNIHQVYDKCFYKEMISGIQLRNVPAQLYPQIFKKIKGLKLEESDLIFFDTNTNQIAKFISPLF
jgi:hypothetical protein